MKISCLICLEVFTEECRLSSTFCGHLFHSNCLEKSLESKNTCPNCRKSCAPISGILPIHQIYLPSISSEISENDVYTKREKKLLQSAAEQGSLEWYKLITENAKNKNPADQLGRTPIHYAAQNGRISICKFILENVVEKNPKDYKGRTPLDFAADVGRLDLCILFYKHITGDHTMLQNTAIEKLFHLAAENGSLALAKLTCRKLKLENYNPEDENGLTLLHRAAKNGHTKLFEFISDLCVDENPAGPQGWTPLHWAARNGHHEIASYLMNNIEPIENINPTDLQGYTPLHFAAQFGHLNVYQLISNGLDNKNPGGASLWNYTPLHMAAANGHTDLCLYILSNVKVRNPEDTDGETPLHLAAQNGHYKICEMITEFIKIYNLCEPNPPDIDGNTPLHWAAENGHLNICQLIMDCIKIKNPKNNVGKTPLDYAKDHPDATIFKGLQDILAEYTRKVRYSCTPLGRGGLRHNPEFHKSGSTSRSQHENFSSGSGSDSASEDNFVFGSEDNYESENEENSDSGDVANSDSGNDANSESENEDNSDSRSEASSDSDHIQNVLFWIP